MEDFTDQEILTRVAGHPIFTAKEKTTSRVCVLKEYTVDPKTLRAFFQEAAVLLRLTHSNIIKLDGVVNSADASHKYLLMPFYENGDLAQWWSAQYPEGLSSQAAITPDPTKTVVQIGTVIRCVLNGLAHIHSFGILHCDIKPGNILIASDDGTALIADFDFARTNKERGEKVYITHMQSTHTVGYTLGFVAPELLAQASSGAVTPTVRSDCYSVGATIGWMILGKERFSTAATLEKFVANVQVVQAYIGQDAMGRLVLLFRGLTSPEATERLTITGALHHPFMALCTAHESEDSTGTRPPGHWNLRSLALLTRINDVTDQEALLAWVVDYMKRSSISQDLDGLEIVSLSLIENPSLWMSFAPTRLKVAAAEAREGTGGLIAARDLPLLMKLIQEGQLGEYLYHYTMMPSECGECLLFHGTSKESADKIKQTGFDFRLSGNGFFGQGMYFAENFHKSHDYAHPDADGYHYMFIARVTIGKPYMAPAPRSFRLPPEVPGTTTGRRFDSVIGRNNDDPNTPREFIVYDRSQAYPELLIKYKL